MKLPLLEERAQEGLFWILPTPFGSWKRVLIPYGRLDNHEEIWRETLAEVVLTTHQQNATLGDRFLKFRELFDAYPRGRIENDEEPLKWVIGFGGDYPPEWNEERLMKSLKVGPTNARVEVEDHWKAGDEHRREADQILGR